MVRGNSTLIAVASPLSAEVLDDVAFQLDPELKDWLDSNIRAHVMQSFAPTCILFISDMVPAKTMSNASIESVPAVLRHLRHGIGLDNCLKQRVSLAVPRWKRVTSARRAATQRPTSNKLDDSDPGLATQRDSFPTAARKQGRLLCQRHSFVTPRSRWVGTLGVAGPLTTSLRGRWVSGLLPPDNGGPYQRAATLAPAI